MARKVVNHNDKSDERLLSKLMSVYDGCKSVLPAYEDSSPPLAEKIKIQMRDLEARIEKLSKAKANKK